MRPQHGPRERLLAAAAPLAERHALDQITPLLVAQTAGLTETDFTQHFKNIGNYFEAVNTAFLDAILARLISEVGSMPLSLERILKASLVQLDYCLDHRALRGLIATARRQIPKVAESQHQRNKATAVLIAIDLKSLGCTEPTVMGRYYCMLVLEAAQIEADAGGPVPRARETLRKFLNLSVSG